VENQQSNNPNFMKYMSNPRSFTLKKWFSGILQNRFAIHENTIERVATAIITEADLEAFGKLMGELFEVGYMKAVNDYREEFEKMGVKITIGTKKESPLEEEHQSVKSGLA